MSRIVLLGPRGAGKTTVGRILASRRGVGFIDLDAEVERAAGGRTIAQIFADEGEVGFRDRESAALAEALARDAGVIATGGGVVVRAANRRLLRQTPAERILLLADAAELCRRIAADPATAAGRPALTALDDQSEMERVLAERLPLYRAVATRELDVGGLMPEDVAELICGA